MSDDPDRTPCHACRGTGRLVNPPAEILGVPIDPERPPLCYCDAGLEAFLRMGREADARANIGDES